MHDLLRANDAGVQVDIAILDFSIAFDTVPHEKLLHKLEEYGVRGNLYKWLTSFLQERHECCGGRGTLRISPSGVGRTSGDSPWPINVPLSYKRLTGCS